MMILTALQSARDKSYFLITTKDRIPLVREEHFQNDPLDRLDEVLDENTDGLLCTVPDLKVAANLIDLMGYYGHHVSPDAVEVLHG